MKIIHNNNLKYTKIPGGSFSGTDPFEMDIGKMWLLSFRRLKNNTLFLNLKAEVNRKQAYIRSVNKVGEQELDLIEKNLGDLINKSYDEILNTDFNYQ